MTPDDYVFLCSFLKKHSGLVLSSDKQYLVKTRLMPIMREHGLSTLSELTKRLRELGSAAISKQVIEAMTTNESFFFRDKTPFDHFKNTMLPSLMEARQNARKIRIWCAASSTGQEPYSLAITIKEMGLKAAGWRFEILATDLSSEVLHRAKEGIYSQFEVQRGLQIQMVLKYFTQYGDNWQIADDIRSMVQFQHVNLLDDFSRHGTFDIIFCRNVLIYFDQDTKIGVLDRLVRQLPQDGYLILGAAETVVGLTRAFQPMPNKRGLYQPVSSASTSSPLAVNSQ